MRRLGLARSKAKKQTKRRSTDGGMRRHMKGFALTLRCEGAQIYVAGICPKTVDGRTMTEREMTLSASIEALWVREWDRRCMQYEGTPEEASPKTTMQTLSVGEAPPRDIGPYR